MLATLIVLGSLGYVLFGVLYARSKAAKFLATTKRKHHSYGDLSVQTKYAARVMCAVLLWPLLLPLELTMAAVSAPIRKQESELKAAQTDERYWYNKIRQCTGEELELVLELHKVAVERVQLLQTLGG